MATNTWDHWDLVDKLTSDALDIADRYSNIRRELEILEKDPRNANSAGVGILKIRLEMANEDILFNHAEILLTLESYKRRQKF